MPVIQPRPGILDIVPYVPGNVDSLDPHQVVYLASNESPLGASKLAIDAYTECAQDLHRYPDGSSRVLRETIAAHCGMQPEQIVCGNGSERLIDLLTRAYAGPGDEVLYSQYGFIMYPICAHAAGATPVTAPETGYTTDVDALLAGVTPRTKIVFVANPNNPTGTYISAAEMQRLRERLPPQVLLVIDSAYAEYVSAADYNAGHQLVENQQKNVVVLHTFSKIFGLAALRLGWACCPAEIADVLNRIRGSFNIATPAQAAGIAALRDHAHTVRAKQHNDTWLPWLQQALHATGLTSVASVGNFTLVLFDDEAHSKAAHKYLLQQHIVVRPVAAYGLHDALRITIGTEQQNRRCVEALQTFVREYSR